MLADPIVADAAIYASLLVMLSLGLTLTYLTTRVPNFAHASFATIGVYAALVAARVWETTPYAAVPVGAALGAAASLALYYVVLRPLIRRGAQQSIQMIATLAFDMVVIAALNIAADHLQEAHMVASREFTLRSYDAEVAGLPGVLVAAPAAVACAAVGLHLALRRTRFGTAMRATIENPSLAGAVGVNVGAVYAASWLLGGAMAGAAGALMALWFQGDPSLGVLLIPSVFAASIAGGFGSLYGAVAGGLVVGLAEILGTRALAGELGAWVIAYRPLIPLLAIVATLLVAPRGLAGAGLGRLRRAAAR